MPTGVSHAGRLAFGHTAGTVAYHSYGDTFEVQIETCLFVLGNVYVRPGAVQAS